MVLSLSFVVYMLTRLLYVIMVIFFFFQAEDGIRDLVRSRGLGDVYKRQVVSLYAPKGCPFWKISPTLVVQSYAGLIVIGYRAVSYTHLTLPTSDLV